MKYRICYKKKDALIFISHLDLQNLFQRSFRRAHIELKLSEGFNPHPKMSYTPPLSLFVSSDDEYFDVELKREYPPKELIEKLMTALPEGLTIKNVQPCYQSDLPLSALADWAQYDILLSYEADENKQAELCREIEELANADTINVEKISKRKPVVKDIKKSVGAVKAFIAEEGREIMIKCILSVKNDSILNPQLFVDSIKQNIPKADKTSIISINKAKTFINA